VAGQAAAGGGGRAAVGQGHGCQATGVQLSKVLA
jgi:hypothetical protein